MKKLLSFAIVALSVSSVCFAQQAPVAVKQASRPAVQAKMLTGKIDTVTPADSAKGIKAQFVIVDEAGNKAAFVVSNSAVVQSTEAAVVGLDKLVKDQKVQVKYHETTEGIKEATLVVLVK
ncbi:MAG: hypothetical protein MUF05_00730 [Candidatus Omnitrophica bacterium]|jgi:hypothetical protein|nr:hypothetical protein [Candidatus Omnitrophota bacterium]